MKGLIWILLLVVGGGNLHLWGQDQVEFEVWSEQSQLAAGTSFTAFLRARVRPGWHLYSMRVPEGGPLPTQITVQEDEVFVSGGEVSEPEPEIWFDENFGMETNYFEGTVDFTVPVVVRQEAAAGNHPLSIKVRFMVCSDTTCLPPQTLVFSKQLVILAGSGPQAGESTTGALLPLPQTPADPNVGDQESVAVAQPPSVNPATGPVEFPVDRQGLPLNTLAYIWFAMTMGALALLTPCVFPMIPITVSYFTKREASTRRRALFEAGTYSIGIILTFTLLGFLLTFLFGAGGINRLAASPFINLLIATIFVVFALSLFGVIELTLPNSWVNAINRKSSATPGVAGIMLMALTFSLTSFTCTVPFVGTVMVAALQGDFLWSLLGVAAFATVFSLPFFWLAVFPSWLQALPRSGNWMNSVKIVMGFLELAAAMKFISNVDLVFQWELITRPVFITVWLAIGLVTSIYLLGWFRFEHESPVESIGASRVLFSVFFLAVSFYLLRGLFGFPLGELDAFLPPRDYGNVGTVSFLNPDTADQEQEVWLTDYDMALAQAQAEDRPIFVDFTGYTCTNCRWMEANVFPLPEVGRLFDQFVLVRLYTDGNDPEHAWNQNFEKERFGTIALPYYAIISPEDETVATFPGLTRNRQEFIDFLEEGLRRASTPGLLSARD